jgi:hypothetical protein
MQVNKWELAKILGCSLPTLATLIDRYGDDFPVLFRGGPGRGWSFEAEAVQTFMADKRAKDQAGDADRQAALRQFALPLGHNGGPAIDEEPSLRPSEQLMMWKVRKLQREEAYACGRLVEVTKISAALETLLGAWNRELHQTVRRFGQDRGLDDDLVTALDRALSNCQRRFVSGMKAVYDPEPSLFESAAE